MLNNSDFFFFFFFFFTIPTFTDPTFPIFNKEITPTGNRGIPSVGRAYVPRANLFACQVIHVFARDVFRAPINSLCLFLSKLECTKIVALSPFGPR